MKPIEVKFLNTPKVTPIPKYKRCWLSLFLLNCLVPNYKLEEDMQVKITFDNNQSFLLIIKKGYECDLASIPRLAWGIYPPDGNYRYIAIVHDILYQSESFTRLINDQILRLGMHEQVPNDVRDTFYKSVRVGGGFVYMGHTKESIAESNKYFTLNECFHT